jgi:hypothetical protein
VGANDPPKSELFAAIRAERDKLDALLRGFDDAVMAAPAREDGWSPKDILAHLTAWEKRLCTWVDRWRSTGDPGRPEPGVTWQRMDPLNARDYAAAKTKDLDAIRAESGASHERVLRVVESMNDEDLRARVEGPEGPSWSWIIGANTYEHYEEHRKEMEVRS